VLVHIEDGRVIKILPDREEDETRRLCVKANTSIGLHDHPNRLNYPLKRVGKRGSDEWQQIGWDQAMDEIARRLDNIRNEYGPESVVALGGTIHTHGDAMAWRWCNLFGTPNMIWLGKNCGEAQVLSDMAVIGYPSMGVMVPGITQCAIFWGVNPAESTPVYNPMDVSWPWLKQAKEMGTKIIVVDPRRTKTAEIADLWLQIRPGTDGALGLGMLNVIINEDLYDKAFVEKWCIGFDQIKALVQEYPPDRVADITWIAEKDIIRAARWYSTLKPATIGWGLADCHIGGGAVKSAVQTKSILRAITGSIGVLGGNFVGYTPMRLNWIKNIMWDRQFDHPLRKKDNLGADRWPIASVKGYKLYRDAMKNVHPEGFGGAQYNMFVSSHAIWKGILTEKPYPVKAVLMQGSNPLLTFSNARTVHKALKSEKLALHVSMDFTLTPSNMLADYVLPATDWLERPEMRDFWGFSDGIQGAKAVLAPMFERHHDYDLWRDLGKRLGQAEYWPDTLEGMYDKMLESSDTTFEGLCAMPGRALPFDIPEEKPYEKKGFGTFSGKVELVPSVFEKLGYDPLPRYEEPPRSPVSTSELAEEYPLILIAGSRVVQYTHTRFREQEKIRKVYPNPLIRMHPDTAADLGISDGDTVVIETPEGKVRQKAKVWDGIHPRVVQADALWWYPELPGKEPCLFGVWESNINAILPDEEQFFDYAGDNYFRALLCRVYKAKEFV
jgi:anaerobic selenocysteine-containing dehydrogenase